MLAEIDDAHPAAPELTLQRVPTELVVRLGAVRGGERNRGHARRHAMDLRREPALDGADREEDLAARPRNAAPRLTKSHAYPP